jgi:hypothetical protein
MIAEPEHLLSELAEVDILKHVAVTVPCVSCGQHYAVTLRQILLAQDMMHEGCPSCADTECLPLVYANFANEEAVRQFEQSWVRLMQMVKQTGFDVALCGALVTH